MALKINVGDEVLAVNRDIGRWRFGTVVEADYSSVIIVSDGNRYCWYVDKIEHVGRYARYHAMALEICGGVRDV